MIRLAELLGCPGAHGTLFLKVWWQSQFLGRITVGLTRSKSLTIVVSPLDMIGLIGIAQVLATLAYGIKGQGHLDVGLAVLP